MKIGLISDTHIPSMGAEPPSQVARAFEGVDLILHAGHVEIASCIKWLERIAPVTATTSWLEGTGEALPRVNTVKVVEAENHTIGICHELILKSLGDDVIPRGDREGIPSWRAAARRVTGHLWQAGGHRGLRLHP
jgi:predicted phosphodiesterase